jgi:hypothetical protein
MQVPSHGRLTRGGFQETASRRYAMTVLVAIGFGSLHRYSHALSAEVGDWRPAPDPHNRDGGTVERPSLQVWPPLARR